jgi:eukaryotic-like serine/threonine-protein kinase
VATETSSESRPRVEFPQRFSERYVLLKELGSGGMGQVYMGVTGEPGAQRVCALKIIRDLARDRDPRELSARFLDEAKVVTKLSHENLVFVFDYGVVSGQGYLAMEFLEGKTLTELWNRCAQRGVGFPIGTSLFLVSELCAGLGYAHRARDMKLVHRDVSPSNVMLSYTGGVKLIDFGLAKWNSKLAETATGINWGKIGYMSPEQHLGRAVDHRSDLFSAGLILWELLTGRQLFPSPESRATDFEIPPPSRFNPNIPPELEQAVRKALAEDPAQRYQTGEEMSAALTVHMPREAGKLALADFMVALFETDIEAEATEREGLVKHAVSILSHPQSSSNSGRGLVLAGAGDGDPLLGAVLADRYFLRRLVGEGAMGRVYEGHHTGIGKRVAIKIPRHGERRKRELVQRFRLEAQAASQIRHPNIADVTDCGTTPDGRFFFVMEFIDGIDVVHLVRQENPLPVERALLIAVQVCRALEAAHKAGIIHRDLKPSNVMLLRDRAHEDADFVKVLDFGVAKFLRADPAQHGGQLTQVDAAVGTPKYMAPEQIERGNDIDFRVDIYAVGGLLYFMLTGGHPPTEGDSVEAVWRKKMTEEALPVRRWRPDLSQDIESLVSRCLAREPGRRPSSMEVLRKDLLATIERLRAVGVSALVRAPSVTSLVHDADRRAQRRNRAAMLVLGIGGTVAGVTALLVDRAVGPDGRVATPVISQPAPARHGSGERSVPPPARVPPAKAPVATAAPAPRPATPPAPPITRPAPPAPSRPAPPRPAPATSASVAAVVPPVEPALRAGRTAQAEPGPRRRPETSSLTAATTLVAEAETRFQEGDLVEAVTVARKAIAKGAGAEGWIKLGKIYRAMQDFPAAVLAYDKAIQLAPGDARAREGLKKATEALGQPAPNN